jgi:uncharacterized protein YjaZ
MTRRNLVKIQFCFPRIPHGKEAIKNKRELVRLIAELMQGNGSIEYAGYPRDKYLYKDLLQHIGNGNIATYKIPSAVQRWYIIKNIYSAIQKCHKKLSLPTKNFVFVFPWLTNKEDLVFEGVMGFTPYSSVFHLFISPQAFTRKSLISTVVHELNHAVFYYFHRKDFSKCTLLDHIITEGLAENFREEVLGGKSAPWSVAVAEKETSRVISAVRPLLHSKSSRIRQEVLFGGRRFKRWTGYSIGYWIVKSFRRKYSEMSWEEIVKMDTKDIFAKSAFMEAGV